MVTYFPKPLNNQVAAISDSLKRTQNGLGIGASGDTHDAIGSGQFVYVRDHSSLAEGLYKSKAAIAQDGALSTSNLTADDSGGLNDLQSQITSLNSNKIDKPTSVAAGKFLQTDSNGDAVWGNAASPTDVANAVTDWLDDNIPTGQTVAVDQSLTVSGAAADAKKTGDKLSDLKSAITEFKSDANGFVNYSRQFLKAENATSGYYYYIGSGTLKKGGGGTSTAKIYEPIPVEANKTYYYRNLYAYFCVLDDGETLSTLTSDTTTAKTGSFTPSNDGFIYITVANAALAPHILTDAPYGNLVADNTTLFHKSLAVDEFVHLRIDNRTGVYDYRNPIEAVRNILDASEAKQYMLDIYPGTYNLQDAIRASEQTGSMWGLTLPNYVHMRGIGERDDIIINCELPNSSSATAVEYTSTINLKQNNSLENLTFTGTNVRYVVHDESSNTYKNWKRIVKNCRFVHNGNAEGFWAYSASWGEGCSSGSYSYFEDCVFENYANYEPFGFHTNTDFDSACTHIFKNCQFITHYIGSNYRGAFMVDDIQCGKPINIEFVGCSFSRYIFIQNHSSATDIEELNITGHGNNPTYLNVYRPNVSTPKRIFARFSDEVKLVHNASNNAIAMGKPLNYSSYPNNTVGIPQSNGIWVCGIALDEIPAKGQGYMQYAGILPLASVGITGISIGDLIGVADYAVAPVTNGTHFARAIQTNVIKFN